MYLLGHIGIVIFVSFILEKILNKNFREYRVILGFAAMFPDFIDKPIGSIFFETGRWFGHSLIFLSTVFIITYLLFDKKEIKGVKLKNYPLVLFIGSLCHLLLDFPGISARVVFWPYFGDFTKGNREDFLFGLQSTRTAVGEVMGTSFLVLMGIIEKWQKRTWYYLLLMILTYISLFFITYLVLVKQ